MKNKSALAMVAMMGAMAMEGLGERIAPRPISNLSAERYAGNRPANEKKKSKRKSARAARRRNRR